MWNDDFLNIKVNTRFMACLLTFVVFFLTNSESTVQAMGQNQIQQNLSATPSDTAGIYNNFANSYLLKDVLDSTILDSAIFYYEEAIKREPDDGGIKFNLAIVYLIKGDTTTADSLFIVGLAQCDSSLTNAYFLLGMVEEKDEKTTGTPGNVIADKTKESLKKASNNLKLKEKSKTDNKKKTKTIRVPGSKQLDVQKGKKYLYWKH